MTLNHVVAKVCGEQFHLLLDGDTAVFATFGPLDDAVDRMPEGELVDTPDHPAAAVVERYNRGDVDALAEIPVRQPGSPFRSAVWQALRDVQPGSPISYTDLAAAAGRPSAVRAAASGCATNQIPLIVPCHRIVRSDGSLGGYAFGLPLKRRLLDHEAAQR